MKTKPLVVKTEAQQVQPWAQGLAANWTRAARATILADMGKVRPASALSGRLKKGRWKTLSYEAGGIAGTMIVAMADAEAPTVRLPLKARGWHAIFVGLFATVPDGANHVWLKLSNDAAFVPRGSSPLKGGYWAIEDVFFKVAKLADAHLEIRPSRGVPSRAALAYVKLVPLTEAERTGFQADRDDRSKRTLAATCDGFSFIYAQRPTTREELLSEVEIYRDTDFGTLLLHIGGADQANYPSKHGIMFGQDLDSFPSPGDRNFAESAAILAREKINPTRTLIEGAHALGMKVHVGLRPGLWSYYQPHTDYFLSPFYRDHPRWRTLDRDGTPVARMSWAVPEVRKHLLDVLRQAVQLGADGAHLVFNRGFPLVLYEPAFCRQFQQRYGKDPRKLNETDPRVLGLRSEIVTSFLRETRQMLKEEQATRGAGGTLALSVCVLGLEEGNLQYGVDIRRWVKEQLVDEVYIYKYGFGKCKAEIDMDFFHRVCIRAGVKVIPVLSIYETVDTTVDKHVREAVELLEKGADGLGVWDAAAEAGKPAWWPMVARLGRKDELRRRLKTGMATSVWLPVHRLGEEIMDGQYPIYWGG
ncbi:MAG: hypothetical protein HY343_00900 [Lentisphaerae bacterium]|nr:hypothetical protein [Lentisphaerota bacterium]